MLMVISPAKTLDDSLPVIVNEFTRPELLSESETLVRQLRALRPPALGKLMDISPKLAELNAERYQKFTTPFTPQNARPALLTFKGDVYEGLRAWEMNKKELLFSQKCLRILSGLYGVLRPLDLMQPYRLEMGTALKTPRGADLYAFWGELISESLNRAMREAGTETLVNLASQEYFKAVRPQALQGRVLHVDFKEKSSNQLKIIGIHAKKARGMMAGFVIRNALKSPAQLRDFNESGYRFEPELSAENRLVFVR